VELEVQKLWKEEKSKYIWYVKPLNLFQSILNNIEKKKRKA